jgi:predicted branched-subunit amino acid permease
MEHTDRGFWHISLEAPFALCALIFGGDAQLAGLPLLASDAEPA